MHAMPARRMQRPPALLNMFMQHNVQEENEEEIEYLDDVDFVESDEDMEDAAYGSGSDASEGIRMTCWIHDESGDGGRVWLAVEKPVMGIHDKHCAWWNRCGA